MFHKSTFAGIRGCSGGQNLPVVQTGLIGPKFIIKSEIWIFEMLNLSESLENKGTYY